MSLKVRHLAHNLPFELRPGDQEVALSVRVSVCPSVCDFYDFFTQSSLNLCIRAVAVLEQI